MLELSKHQNSVGKVLQDGSKLISNGILNQNEDNEVRQQMKLLNDMWENLRIKAVEKQSKLHETLMKLQTEQLNQMDLWLSQTEKRIETISQLSDSLDGLKDQKQELANLQDDLIKEQEAVDCLKQIIVVVDDTTEDQAFTDLETKLTNLSDCCEATSARVAS
jgi:dystrophin